MGRAARRTKVELAPWARYRPPEQLLALDELVTSDSVRASLAAIPAWLDAEQRQALIIRGPQHNGRRTVLGAIARATGRGLLEVNGRRWTHWPNAFA